MNIGDIFWDVTSGDFFEIGERHDWWLIDGDRMPRSKSHGYDNCTYIGKELPRE